MLKVTIEIDANDYTQEMSAQDQGSVLTVTSSETYQFVRRDDSSGMGELKLAQEIREFLRHKSI